MKKLLLATALLAFAVAPVAIAQAAYPDNNRPVAQSNGNGSGGIPSQLYAYTCYTQCNYNSCWTNCF